jgi:phosphatidate cytidylyltransferase
MSAVGLTLLGVLYAGGTISLAYNIRHHEYAVGAAAGTALLLFPLVLTWIGDTAAYAVGRKIGRRKLMPDVSPGKTVEGALAALIATTLTSVIYARLVLEPFAQLGFTLVLAVVFGAVVSVAGQIGDLAESLLKRSAGVKDSSNLLPGHGGVLDRMDALYFVLPVSYLLMNMFLMPAPRYP